MKKIRKNSFAFCGGAFGDEGKGRIVDEYVDNFSKKGFSVIVYRDNGGANAGHTVELSDGRRIAMHLLPSGVLCKSAKVILGKCMVIHPGDLLTEINEVKDHTENSITAEVIIDENAYLSLDTHRAYEAALKNWQKGGNGATGRGIAPAYADILLRHPLQIKDIANFNENKLSRHYRLYQALLKGLAAKLSSAKVPAYNQTELQGVGTETEFIKKLEAQGKLIKNMVKDANMLLKSLWENDKNVFIFEKAQAIGLDCRYGVYPDITASDTTFDGILSSTEGIIDPDQIGTRAAVVKATYMSSVGSRVLPTVMNEKLAVKIRKDAHEYGATTKRPRDIAYIDLPALRFFMRVGNINSLILTHMDIVYPNIPVKVCTKYRINGKEVEYRPSQEYLSKVKPEYVEFKPWDRSKIQSARNYRDLPPEAKKYISFIAKSLSNKVSLITTGPQRNQTIKIP